LYGDAERSLLERMAADLERDAVATAGYRNRRVQVLRAELSALQDRAIPTATGLVTNAYVTASTQTTRSVGLAAVDFGTGLHAEALTILADNMASALNGAAETVGRRVADIYRREGLRASARLFAEGTSRSAASGILTQSLTAQGIGSFVDAAGREWTLGSYSRMAIRTTTSEAATQGVVNACLDSDIDLMEIAVADPCPICAPYDGNIYSLTGTTPGYEPLDDQPPFHPNCECTLVASLAEFDRPIA
jgi:hypothetical protein